MGITIIWMGKPLQRKLLLLETPQIIKPVYKAGWHDGPLGLENVLQGNGFFGHCTPSLPE